MGVLPSQADKHNDDGTDAQRQNRADAAGGLHPSAGKHNPAPANHGAKSQCEHLFFAQNAFKLMVVLFTHPYLLLFKLSFYMALVLQCFTAIVKFYI